MLDLAVFLETQGYAVDFGSFLRTAIDATQPAYFGATCLTRKYAASSLGMVDDQVGTPGVKRTAVAEVAVGNGHRLATGRIAGDDVAAVVTNVERAIRATVQQPAGVQNR